MRYYRYAVLAESESAAKEHAQSLRWYSDVLYLYRRAELYLLYGLRGVKFDVMPGTHYLEWHRGLQEHFAEGRLVSIRNHVIRDA